jgi:hypothetical protein
LLQNQGVINFGNKTYFYIGDPKNLNMAQTQVTVQQEGSAPQHVAAVSVKLPEFWTNDPDIWFARVQAQFNMKGITSDGTKFDHVVASLDSKTAAEVRSVILHPPATDKFEAIKQALIKAFGKTQCQKDAELLSMNGLGDRKPTALLRHINSLNDDPETLKRALFLMNLPIDVRNIIVSQKIESLDELAEAADRVVDSKSVSTSQVMSSINLSDEYVAHIKTDRRTRAESNKPICKTPAGPKKSDNRAQTETNQFICYFHSRFGSNARRCAPDCIFSDLVKDSGNAKAGR